jgi:hypothetical protein
MGPYSESADEELEQLEFAKVVEKEGNKLKLTGLGRDIAEILEKNTGFFPCHSFLLRT